MRIKSFVFVSGILAMVFAGPVACDQSDTQAPPQATPAKAKPASKPPQATMAKANENTPESSDEQTLALTGIQFDVPPGWQQEPAPASPMGPKAVFILTPAEGDKEECSVRITYFPGMKGKDNMNIDRWLNQVKHEDGSPSTRADAQIEIFKLGQVQVTMVDVHGSISSGMGMGGQGKDMPNQRLIAAIVDHPQGPHFVKALGDVASMEKWQASIEAFLKSAHVG